MKKNKNFNNKMTHFSKSNNKYLKNDKKNN